MAALNYAKQYQQALEQEFPYVLYFGALFNTPNNGRYRWVNSNVIEVPTITTTGRTVVTEILSARRNVTTTTPGHLCRLPTTEHGLLWYILVTSRRPTR